MKNTTAAILTVAVGILAATAGVPDRRGARPLEAELIDGTPQAARGVEARLQADIAALRTFRPGYAFWREVFTIPDGSVVFGSAADGRRLAVVRASRNTDRDAIARRLEASAGPVLHNETRGRSVSPGLARYGMLLSEWGAIYERFGVPAEIGLAQALLESGFVGTRRSEANAIGLCQWLESNWRVLDRFDPAVLEIENQTTQAAFCAAYVSVLATKYDSFIPALSAHHAGGTNVGRVLVNGERLGGRDARERYFLGSDFALDLRTVASGDYKDIYVSYGPRSYRYAEMVFGNASRVTDEIARIPQRPVYAMRTSRSLPLAEIERRTGLTADEIRRYNPSLVKQVPAGATLYLPAFHEAFGRDVSFWRQPASGAYTAILREFVSLAVPPEHWDTPAFAKTLKHFERRFRDTGTEEGIVMATVIAYVRAEGAGPRSRILADFRTSGAILDLFEQGVRAAETAAE